MLFLSRLSLRFLSDTAMLWFSLIITPCRFAAVTAPRFFATPCRRFCFYSDCFRCWCHVIYFDTCLITAIFIIAFILLCFLLIAIDAFSFMPCWCRFFIFSSRQNVRTPRHHHGNVDQISPPYVAAAKQDATSPIVTASPKSALSQGYDVSVECRSQTLVCRWMPPQSACSLRFSACYRRERENMRRQHTPEEGIVTHMAQQTQH